MNWKKVGYTAILAFLGSIAGHRFAGIPGMAAGIAAGVVIADELTD